MRILFIASIVCLSLSARAASDVLFEDFESGAYVPKWTPEGDAFGKNPALGTFKGQHEVSGFLGRGLVNSFYGGDVPRGRLVSAPFKIEHKYMRVLAGGGMKPQRLYLRIVSSNGTELGRITGNNSERLEPKCIDVSKNVGETAFIEIVDDDSGPWGHINIDDIRFTDFPDIPCIPDGAVFEKSNKFVHFPVNNLAPEREVKIFELSNPDAPKLVAAIKVRIDADNPQWVMSYDLSEFAGNPVRVEVKRLVSESSGLGIFTSDKFIANSYPNEILRPQYHFSTPHGWINDPNGLVYFGGKWHMYYQLTPYSTYNGAKYWWHAVSDDLMHWKHMPVAIKARFFDGGWANEIYSGTAFADLSNKSGLFGGNGGIVFAYTLTGRGDFVAYSPDGTGIKTFDAPITSVGGRDPCIFYHTPTKKWVVLRYEIFRPTPDAQPENRFAFYVSADLKSWKRTQMLENFYECPYIVPLAENGDKNKMRYLIFDASGECVVGDFDGEEFTPLSDRLPRFIHGNAYTGQIWNNAPDGRVVEIAWMPMPVEPFARLGMPFSQTMTLPFELSLIKKDGKFGITAKPAAEVEKLCGKPQRLPERVALTGSPKKIISSDGTALSLEAEFDISNSNVAGLNIGPASIVFDKIKNSYRISCPSRKFEGIASDIQGNGGEFKMSKQIDGTLKMRIFVDACILELFHGGEGPLISLYVPFGREALEISAFGDGAILKSLELSKMSAAYDKGSLQK